MADSNSNKSSAPSTLRLLVGVALGISFGAILANTVPDESGGTVLFGFLAIVVSGIAVHELGHALAIIFVRFRLVSIAVGPFVLQFGAAGLRLRTSAMALGGLTLAVPNGTENLRTRFMVVIAAGPAASVLAGLIGIAGGQALRPPWAGWISAWGYGSLVLCAMSLIPIRKFYYSDGARLALLMRNTPAAERNCAMLALSAAASAGARPREWAPDLLRVACAGCDDGSGDGVRAAIFGYENAMDNGKFEEAGKYLELALARVNTYPPMVKAGVALDAAFFHAMVRADALTAREWFNKSNTKLVHDRYAVLLVEAAVLLAEGRIADANRKITESRAVLSHATFAGFARAAEDWLNNIEAICKERGVAIATEH